MYLFSTSHQDIILFQKRGTPKLFLDKIYGAPYCLDKKYMLLFSPDFKYKVDPFSVDVIDNYVKELLGGIYRELSNLLQRDH